MTGHNQNPDVTPKRDALPPASILSKFKETNVSAGHWIMAKAETIARERRAHENEAFKRQNAWPRVLLSKTFWLSVVNGMGSALHPLHLPVKHNSSGSPDINPRRDWITVGNDLRAAMEAYMIHSRFDRDSLSEHERLALKPIDISKSFGSPRFG